MQAYRRYIAVDRKENKQEKKIPEMHGSNGALLFDRKWKEERAAFLE